MNIFELFVKMTHPEKKAGWVETTGYFTGETRKPYVGRNSGRKEIITRLDAENCREYAIRYYAEDKERIGWYLFYPLPDPDPEEIEGESMKIRYKKKRPWIFKNAEKDSTEL